MLQRLYEILQDREDKKNPFGSYLWALNRPYQVLPALVWGGNQRSIQEQAPEDSDIECPYARWFPAITSNYEEINGHDFCKYVLCDPLLMDGCHKPWRTHVRRIIIVEWAAEPAAPPADIPSTVQIEELPDSDEEGVAAVSSSSSSQTPFSASPPQGNEENSKKGDKEQQISANNNAEDQREQDNK